MVTMTSTRPMYIYNLPHPERKELCRVLNQNDKWEELGADHMNYDTATIEDIRRGLHRSQSPSEELLTLWGHQNHTVLELFILLSRMHHYQAMTILKPFVHPKYHRFIHEGEHNLSTLLYSRNKNEPCTKDLGIAMENFDSSLKIINGPIKNEPIQVKVQIPDNIVAPNPALVTRDNNESVAEMLQQSPAKGLNPRAALPESKSPVHESAAGAIAQIPYHELQAATDNWNKKTILGRGGFGIVFKGRWKHTLVAIKRIEMRENTPENHNIQIKQSITELHCLNSYRHDNVLPLYGYSISGPHPCLVYQYMPGGCLEQRLRITDENKQLQWEQRLNIAKGVARGLQFLHTIGDKPLIHGDIKSANILLDLNNEARIGDFGLAREGPQSDYTHMKVSRIHGTRPYLPDDFLRSKKLSVKVDTYSFGVVLFELATGLSAYSEHMQPHKFLKDHVILFEGDLIQLTDKRIGAEEVYFYSFINLGRECVSVRARDRPEMLSVLMRLEAIPKS